MFAGTFAPLDWEFCAGQLLSISENDALFSLIGTTYGGDGQNTFALPDLRGRLPIHVGGGFQMGQTGGVEQVTINSSQLPAHNHALNASEGGASSPLAANLLVAQTQKSMFRAGTTTVAMAAASISFAGGAQPHENLQPYLCVNFIISLYGIYPSRP